MKFQQIFAMEFRYQVRRATTWLYFGVMLGIAFLIVIGNYSYDARDGYFLLNAPIVIASVTVICSVKWLVIAASVAGDAAARDVYTRMHSLTYTAPTSKAAYLGGRSLSLIAWLFTGTSLTDTVTALKLFRRADVAALPLETSGFELDHELTARMAARGKTIAEVPIRYYPRSREEGKKIGARDWFIAVRTFWRYRKG